jgi:hypothetical protein
MRSSPQATNDGRGEKAASSLRGSAAPALSTIHVEVLSPEQNLWQEVLTRAVLDWRSNHPRHKARIEAGRFLFHDDENFSLVCEFAGVFPQYIREGLKHAA